MRLKSSRKIWITLAVILSVTAAVAIGVNARQPASPVATLTAGKADLQSAGPLAFGPDGILFVADSMGAAVVALDTGDHAPASSSAKIEIDGINQKVAALLGTAPDQILINDVKVNPISKNVYLSVSRGRGPDATPVILRVDATGKMTELSLDNIKHASVSLADAPESKADDRGRNPRMQTITDMAFVNGKVFVAGLSNEEWSSALRSIAFPFTQAEKGATLQIWHASHGDFETQAPVRTFIPYTIAGQSYILAAYTCTPLVKIPVSDLQPGAQVKGTTIADLGMGNSPLDMVPYRKAGHDYILVANSSRGVVRVDADRIETYPAITSPTKMDVGGVPSEPQAQYKDVVHLTQLDDADALILTSTSGTQNLQTIALP